MDNSKWIHNKVNASARQNWTKKNYIVVESARQPSFSPIASRQFHLTVTRVNAIINENTQHNSKHREFVTIVIIG